MLLLCLYTTPETTEMQAFSAKKRPKKGIKNNNNYFIKLGNITTKRGHKPYMVFIICKFNMIWHRSFIAGNIKNPLTLRGCCGILFRRDEFRSFFCAIRETYEVKTCVPELHLPAQSARTETTIRRRIRRHIRIVWKQRNIADFARSTRYIRRRSNGRYK